MNTSSPEWFAWYNMHQRCTNPKVRVYRWYGAKGISVCDRWATFEAFVEDMGPRPTARHTLDRKNGTLGYSPENCRWATWAEQRRNVSDNRWIEHNGERLILPDWATKTGIPLSTLRWRLRTGWPVGRALSELPGQGVPKNPHPRINCFGESMTLGEWSKKLGISATTLWVRLNRLKWPLERALSRPPRRYLGAE